MEPVYKNADNKNLNVSNNVVPENDPITAIVSSRSALIVNMLNSAAELSKSDQNDSGALIDLVSNRTRYDTVSIPNNERYVATKLLETIFDYMEFRAKGENDNALVACQYLIRTAAKLCSNVASNI